MPDASTTTAQGGPSRLIAYSAPATSTVDRRPAYQSGSHRRITMSLVGYVDQSPLPGEHEGQIRVSLVRQVTKETGLFTDNTPHPLAEFILTRQSGYQEKQGPRHESFSGTDEPSKPREPVLGGPGCQFFYKLFLRRGSRRRARGQKKPRGD